MPHSVFMGRATREGKRLAVKEKAHSEEWAK
jgi:hypothetical protein